MTEFLDFLKTDRSNDKSTQRFNPQMSETDQGEIIRSLSNFHLLLTSASFFSPED